MPDERGRERDLILAPNEYAYILDETKGNIINYVGPHKTSLANTDQPVVFNSATKRFEECSLETAIQTFAIAPEGWYIVLKNPSKDGHPPKTGTANNLPELDIGRKVNIPGPVSFAVWPGQMVRVIQGHHLHSNQYLIVRVYDEEAARKNWKKAVIKPQTLSSGEEAESGHAGKENVSGNIAEVKLDEEIPILTMGKWLVIKGTEVSFYIPPTGISVVPNSDGEFVRNAVTLERLEYCILLDEDGNKRYIRGPAVVFPKPTETFVQKDGSRKFKAIELSEISGIYVKVITPYEEEGKSYREGEELFITGKDQMIYFPRPEHAIVRYGEQEVNYAVAIPAGEGRYVLDRDSGQIMLKKGPCMFLPDPRNEVIVRRVLDPKEVSLWFPGNQEALEYNIRLQEMNRQRKGEDLFRDKESKTVDLKRAEAPAGASKPVKEGFVGDEFTRRQSFTSPRTITLNTKYEGAVSINVWTGYAVLIVSKTGERKVIVGPKTHLLEYDETLEKVEFSTGTPKRDDALEKTVYLRVLHNKVSDIVTVETADLCQVRIHLSYRVDFEGDPDQWFRVENYVKFLTDHMRSMLRYAIRKHGVEEFYAHAVQIVRDAILGQTTEERKRTGRIFPENGMRIYDVEILDVKIGDQVIADLLVQAQHSTVEQTLELAAERRLKEVTQQKETIKQDIEKAKAATLELILTLQMGEVLKRLDVELSKIGAEIAQEQKRLNAKQEEQATLNAIHQAELSRQKAKYDLELTVESEKIKQRLEMLQAEVMAVVEKAKATSPQLISALQAFSDKALAERMAESMSPLAILGGKSITDVFAQLLKGSVLEQSLSLPK